MVHDYSLFVLTLAQWLQTDMGGENADLTVPQGAEAVLSVVNSVTHDSNGRYKNILVPGWDAYSGQDLPW